MNSESNLSDLVEHILSGRTVVFGGFTEPDLLGSNREQAGNSKFN